MDIKWSVLPVLMVLLVITSCKKNFLDRQPLGRYTDADIPAGSYESKVFAAYAKLRANGFNGRDYTAIHSFRADESEKGSTIQDGAPWADMYDDFQYNKSNGTLQTYWTDHYALIIAANEIIADIDSLQLNDAPTLVNKAEAKFLRAFAYFDLVRSFGQVPLITQKITDAAQVNKPKSTSDQIFALIDADLQEAASVLPVSWEARFIGRLTKGAALAMQARTFLWRKNWSAALGAAKSVIDLNRYSLVPNYISQFREEGENGPESIFEIQAVYTPTQTNLGIEYANQQGVRGSGSWDLGWGWNTPTQNLVDSFETGDPRRTATILYSGQPDPLYGQVVPSFPTVPRLYWNMKVYTNPADRLAKNSRFGQWMNHRIIRYADVLLMAAEAANELGGTQNTDDALKWLEMVRARARGTNNNILPKVTTTNQAALRKAIQHERLVEFGMEEQRFFDLVRWGIDVEVMGAAGKTNYQTKHRLLPIPQAEIDKSGGVLIQNPDYQ
ncbi:MAG: RagB/SusD family nutrient uptake outer membrane protein [Flavisolibacter sp.]|nr:RagB/SusD family nutrient uptake outer membrane protein [Flavisolibacter sp.]MBD0375322.1 RagB/SusD family nutrient uptake outer membrane protein [Flavisolibacter sp.]